MRVCVRACVRNARARACAKANGAALKHFGFRLSSTLSAIADEANAAGGALSAATVARSIAPLVAEV